MMEKVEQLLKAAHAVSNDSDVHFRGTKNANIWICAVYIGRDVILFESAPGSLDEVVDSALTKLKGMSQQMQAVITIPPKPDPQNP